MFYRITRKGRAGRPKNERSQGSEYHPPRHWLPDPVSRFGATFYAFAGAALWEAVDASAHYFETVAVPALVEAAETVAQMVSTMIG